MIDKETKDIVTDLISQSRGVLIRGETPASISSATLPGLERALLLLTNAMERLINSSSVYVDSSSDSDTPLEEYDLGDLEKLYANISNRIDHTTKFIISFPEVELSIDNIWPDGNAPENPTAEDVIKEMKGTLYTSPLLISQAWNLIDTLYVRRYGDEPGNAEVEWDGS